MMKVGIICEGPTDFVAIENFFGAAMAANGIECEFVSVQPDMDNTRPNGGWASVLNWLLKNPPDARALRYFGSGLFSISSASYDALLIQMDADILDDPNFQRFSINHLGYHVKVAEASSERADEIREVLRIAGRFGDMTERDQNRHVLSPAVESTENWCVAAFTMPPNDFETLSNQDLTDAFMSALHRSEGADPTPPYANIDKSMQRRSRFCRAHAAFHGRVAQGCEQFRVARDQLVHCFHLES